MSDTQVDPPAGSGPTMRPAYPINCRLIKNIAWRTLLNRDTVSEREIEALAASVISYIKETEMIEPCQDPR